MDKHLEWRENFGEFKEVIRKQREEISELYIEVGRRDSLIEVKNNEIVSLRQEIDIPNHEKDNKIVELINKLNELNQLCERQRISLENADKEKEGIRKELETELDNLKIRFKDFFIQEIFDNREELRERDIDFLLELYYERKKLKVNIKENEEPNDDLEGDYKEGNFYEDEYTKSETCVCGSSKRWGAKGCEECKKKADNWRRRLGIGMAEAWRKVWETYRKNIEKRIKNKTKLD